MNSLEPNEKPLQSWKEIAAFLERDVRTAHRWEKRAGLPVRRHTDGKRSSVYAYPSELESWRSARPLQADDGLPHFWKRPRTWFAAGALAAGAAAIVYGPFLNPKAPTAEAAEGAMRSERMWTGDVAQSTAKLSSDGNSIIFTDWETGDFRALDTSSGESRRLTGKGPLDKDSSYAETGVVSPDGKRLAAGWFDGDLGAYQLRVGTMPEPGETDDGRVIFQPPPERSSYVAALGWLSDSKALFFHSSGADISRLATADVSNDQIQTLRSFDWSGPFEVFLSPDRRWIAYDLSPNRDALQSDIFVLAADGSMESVLVEHPADDRVVGWAPDGSHLLFRSLRSSGQSLWAVRIEDGHRAGEPRLITSEFAAMGSLGVTPTGDLYYRKREGTLDVYEARIDTASGKVLQSPHPIPATTVGDNFDPVYSPDGKWMAYLSNDNFGDRYLSTHIVVRSLSTGEEKILPVRRGGVRNIAWSPDSTVLMFRAASSNGPSRAFKIALDDDTDELLFHTSVPDYSPHGFTWMPQGHAVAYQAERGEAHLIHDLDTGEERQLPGTTDDAWAAALSVSPDGICLAYLRGFHGKLALSVLDLGSGARKDLWSTEIQTYPWMATGWSADSKTILLWIQVRDPTGKDQLFELWAVDMDSGEARKTELTVKNMTRPVTTLSMHPDGERIAFSAGQPRFQIWKLANFLDRLNSSD